MTGTITQRPVQTIPDRRNDIFGPLWQPNAASHPSYEGLMLLHKFSHAPLPPGAKTQASSKIDAGIHSTTEESGRPAENSGRPCLRTDGLLVMEGAR